MVIHVCVAILFVYNTHVNYFSCQSRMVFYPKLFHLTHSLIYLTPCSPCSLLCAPNTVFLLKVKLLGLK